MNETNKVNFNNSDGSFNKDLWLDFMNTSIQSIPYINSWKANTVGLVNQQSKEIDWSPSSCKSLETNNFAPYCNRNHQFQVFDKTRGWVNTHELPSDVVTNNEKLTENVLYLINPSDWQKGAKVCVIYPDKTWRYLGFWEYSQYGLKKYIPNKIKEQLVKLGVL